MHESLVEFTQSFPVWLQWAGVMLAAATPFVESYYGTLIGIVAGIPAPTAITAAIVGNVTTMLACVFIADAARRRMKTRKVDSQEHIEGSAKKARVKRLFDRFGVPGVSLFGQVLLPSQITSGMMVSFGASRNRVIVWQVISIALWAGLFALLGQAGLALLG